VGEDHVGRREVFQALVVSAVIVMADELIDLRFKVSRQKVVFQQNPVLQGLMPALDLEV